MLDLRRLRLLHELHERGTIAAVADALQFTPSAVSQQLAVLERETGVPLLERAGRGVRLTDAALVLVEHAGDLLARAAAAEADLAASAGAVVGRARVATFQSAALHLVAPAVAHLHRAAPRLRCEVVEAEPERALPALALADHDLVVADEWQHHPRVLPRGVERHELLRDPVRVVLPSHHPLARRHPEAVSLAALADAHWTAGHEELGWDEMTRWTCREHGGFDPDIRHRTNDAIVTLELVARGLTVALLPGLPLLGRSRGIAVRAIAEAPVHRNVFAATRATDAARPSTRAVVGVLRATADDIGSL